LILCNATLIGDHCTLIYLVLLNTYKPELSISIPGKYQLSSLKYFWSSF